MKGVDGGLAGSEVSILSADFEYESGAFTLNGLWADGSLTVMDHRLAPKTLVAIISQRAIPCGRVAASLLNQPYALCALFCF